MTSTRSRSSYQEGSFSRVKRAKGPDVWIYRWRELQKDSHRVQRKQVIGDVERYPRKADVKKAVENFRAEINARENSIGRLTVDEAWGHFQKHELYDPTSTVLLRRSRTISRSSKRTSFLRMSEVDTTGLDSSRVMTSTIQFDGLGRHGLLYLPNLAKSELTYDSLGRLSTQANPHFSIP